MKNFIDKDFLLTSKTAQILFHEYAAKMPIIDYHCHIAPQEIAENRKFENITQMWLEGDHYKWRIMRSDGVKEKYITGDASDKEKFIHFAKALSRCAGNPMYHWCHLELRNYFGYTKPLTAENAEEIYEHCSKRLKEGGLSVRDLIKQSNVYFIGTTDDPTDSLEWHKKISEKKIEELKVAPSFRPDKLVNIDKAIWLENVKKLESVTGAKLQSLQSFKNALAMRVEHFSAAGCRAADHGMDYVCCTIDEQAAETALKKALQAEPISTHEAESFKTELCLYLAAEYAKRGWAMQIHFNCLRNPNDNMFSALGADTGFDCMNSINCTMQLASLLNTLNNSQTLPKTIIYSLNPADNAVIDTIIGAFQGEGLRNKIQHGSAWWFNDTKTGMLEQLTSLANLSVLGNFIGMLTDSRSFLSYARHEYFRRILCELIGSWIESGEFNPDINAAGAIVQDICFNNAKEYFNI